MCETSSLGEINWMKLLTSTPRAVPSPSTPVFSRVFPGWFCLPLVPPRPLPRSLSVWANRKKSRHTIGGVVRRLLSVSLFIGPKMTCSFPVLLSPFRGLSRSSVWIARDLLTLRRRFISSTVLGLCLFGVPEFPLHLTVGHLTGSPTLTTTLPTLPLFLASFARSSFCGINDPSRERVGSSSLSLSQCKAVGICATQRLSDPRNYGLSFQSLRDLRRFFWLIIWDGREWSKFVEGFDTAWESRLFKAFGMVRVTGPIQVSFWGFASYSGTATRA